LSFTQSLYHLKTDYRINEVNCNLFGQPYFLLFPEQDAKKQSAAKAITGIERRSAENSCISG